MLFLLQLSCIRRSSLLETVQPFANVHSYTDEDENAWLASVRLHCPKQQAAREEDLYWRQDVENHTRRAIQYGKVTKVYLETSEADAIKVRDQFERQWREWLEAKYVFNGIAHERLVPLNHYLASRVVNEGLSDAKLAGSTGQNSLF